MTRWGLLLLIAYIALGSSRLAPRAAARTAVWLTIAVLVGVGLKTGAL